MRINFIQDIIDKIRGKKHYVRPVKPDGFFGQYGEDAVLNKLLNNKTNGFYIDVGANHPTELSNTYYFYLKGWRGINIEANPLLISNFNEVRPEDINLNLGAADVSSDMTFYVLSANTVSSFSEKSAKENCKNHNCTIVDKIKVKTDTLENIINHYAPDKHIDFMSVDVEGFDIQALKGNDWNKYRPDFLMVETNGKKMTKLNRLIDKIDYKLIYDNGTNSIYKNVRL